MNSAALATIERQDIYSYSYNCDAMPTTIQVSTITKQLLDMMKERDKAASYDAVLRKLLDTHLKIPKSMLGSAPQLGGWNKETDRMKFHGE